MSECTPDGNQTTVTTIEGTVAETIESFTGATAALAESLDAPEPVVQRFVESAEGLAGLVREVAQQSAQAQSRAREAETKVEQLESELANARETRAQEDAEIRGRLHQVEEQCKSMEGGENSTEKADSPGSNPEGSVSKTTTQAPESPRTALGDCVTLPQPIQEAELSANVRRSAEIAAGAIDYCRSVPAGYAITSSELRTVLTALKEGGGRTYTETVGRVIDYLDELGGDCVEVTETMGGERTVVFSDEFVKRTVAWRNETASNGVVADERARG